MQTEVVRSQRRSHCRQRLRVLRRARGEGMLLSHVHAHVEEQWHGQPSGLEAQGSLPSLARAVEGRVGVPGDG